MDELTKTKEDEPIGFGPTFSDETMKLIESVSNSNNVGIKRRMALAACARSAIDLAELSIESPEAYEEMLIAIKEFKEHVEGLLEIATAANIRILAADCRENKEQEPIT